MIYLNTEIAALLSCFYKYLSFKYSSLFLYIYWINSIILSLFLFDSMHYSSFLFKFLSTFIYPYSTVLTSIIDIFLSFFLIILSTFFNEQLLKHFKYQIKILQISSGLRVIVKCSYLSIHLLRHINKYSILNGNTKFLNLNSLHSPINIIGLTFPYSQINSI